MQTNDQGDNGNICTPGKRRQGHFRIDQSDVSPRHARADKAVSQLPDKVEVRLPKANWTKMAGRHQYFLVYRRLPVVRENRYAEKKLPICIDKGPGDSHGNAKSERGQRVAQERVYSNKFCLINHDKGNQKLVE